MSTRACAIGIWAAVAVSALYWGSRPFVFASRASQAIGSVSIDHAIAPGDLARLLGAGSQPAASEAPVLADARLRLTGVVSPHADAEDHEGIALIAIDGRLPQVFRVGAVVDGANVLQAVDVRGVRLGPRDGPAAMVLSLAPSVPTSAVMAPPALPGTVQAGPLVASTRPAAPPTQQELFRQRQQEQFEQEEAQNRAP